MTDSESEMPSDEKDRVAEFIGVVHTVVVQNDRRTEDYPYRNDSRSGNFGSLWFGWGRGGCWE